jgi:hypothetical protein
MRSNAWKWLAAAIALILGLPGSAHAYLDPSTGSMLLSALISLAVTTGFAIQSYGYKLLRLLRLRGPRRSEPPGPPGPDAAAADPRSRGREAPGASS